MRYQRSKAVLETASGRGPKWDQVSGISITPPVSRVGSALTTTIEEDTCQIHISKAQTANASVQYQLFLKHNRNERDA